MSAEITTGDLAQFKQDLQATPGASALQKAVMNNGINATAENTDSKVAMTPTFSIELDTGSVANPKAKWPLLDVCRPQHDASRHSSTI